MKIYIPVALLSLTACATLPEAAPQTLRVMSYNIRYANDADRPNWGERREALAKQVAFTDPDILGVQEAQPVQVAYLAAQWPGYDHYGLGRDDGVNGETTTLFWRRDRFETVSKSHQWCSPTPDRPGKGWDAAWPRTITRLVLRDRLSGKVLDVRNTHLDNEGAVARENCAKQVAGIVVESGALVIVLGDMNSGPDSAPYRVLTGDALGLKDARKAATVDFGPPGTFNGFDLSATQGEAIDHIFVPRGLAVTRYGVLTDSFSGKVISDHFPVVADIRVD
ncbi:endonuclease/Exonuclease/phosphatase family protein [Asticcacaulis biprosthecium C19]|uniref:Endonuclease/Exonuclease/phosphatase family protein n=1 Tax=Asticcacaulis biprosthecium C19 TaxID=715226 RepID=F4QH58_9CAUL|nr:endonuclease/exonuclease/phosphatase family protein [Asticcacaulis biprosthecium]EGF92595.1 endonuclease/Exonuclease/phosphatase family protein [Asticcacaulis biprosthecium C19]